MAVKWQGFRAKLWREKPSGKTLINSGASSVTVSLAAIQSYSLFMMSTKPASHSVTSGAYVLGRDIRVNSVVPLTSFMFVKSVAATALEVVVWELLNPNMKLWR
jgi:uncharacterized membrane protein